MRSFFSDLGLFNYILLVVVLSVVIVIISMMHIRIHISIINTNPTIEEIQEQYIKDLDRSVEAKRKELRRKGLLLTDLQ